MKNLIIDHHTSIMLDLLRGLAALLVMIGHMRALFFVTYEQVASPNIVVNAIYLLTSLGHQAVIIFFVLSGFLISATVLRLFHENKWSWKSYLWQRLTRLYIVLIPALCVGAFWDYIGSRLFFQSQIYEGSDSNAHIIPFAVSERFDLATFFGNVLFLQEIFVTPFGSNSPLWSLSYEFWYYMLFPCICMAFGGATSISKRIVYAVAILAISALVGKSIMLYFGTWLCGTAIIFMPPLVIRNKPGRAAVLCTAATVALVSLIIKRFELFPSVISDYLVAVAFSTFIYIFKHNGHLGKYVNVLLKNSNVQKLAKGLSGFSYTLYLVHFPILVFIHAWYMDIGGGKWQPDINNIFMALIIFLALIVYAWSIAKMTEARTNYIRTYLAGFAKGKKYDVSAKT